MSLTKALAAFCVGFVLGFASCTGIPSALDVGVSAAEGNDPTLVLEGCGQKSASGYVFCKLKAGTPGIAEITMVVPKVVCTRPSCASYQFLKLDGNAGVAGGIAQGETTKTFKVSEITGSDTLSTSNDGEYQVLTKLYYLDSAKAEHVVFTKGFVRINVLSHDYEPVGCNDPAIAWTTAIAKGCKAQWTTLLRGAVCGTC